MVATLLQHGADVNVKDSSGWTPLYVRLTDVLRMKTPNNETKPTVEDEIVQLLLLHGATVSSNDYHWWAILNRTVDVRDESVLKLLIQNEDVNVKNEKGSTPLHIIARSPDMTESVVNVALDNRARVNAKDIFGLTPLHEAAATGNLNVISLLITKGADVNCEAKDGWTPLHAAMYFRRKDVQNFLLSKGAFPQRW